MKKTAILLCLVMIFGVLAMPASAAGSLREPTDVPKVFISTSESLSRDYIDCTVEIIDEKGGTHEAIRDNDSKVKIRGNSTSSGEKPMASSASDASATHCREERLCSASKSVDFVG